MMRGKGISALLLSMMLLGVPTGAKALTFNVVDDDVNPDGVNLATMCSNPVMCLSTETLVWDGVAGTVSGTVDVGGGFVDFDITVSVLAFSGSDNGVSSWKLTTLNYATVSSLAFDGGDTDSDFSVVTTAGNLATASGTEDEDGGTSAFSDTSVAITLDCQEIATGVLKCGMVVSGLTFNVDVNGAARYIDHTLDFTAVPEPAAPVMALTVALVGLAYGRRERTS